MRTMLVVIAAAVFGTLFPSSLFAQDKNPLAEPKNSLAYQLELLKAGDADKLKECFTARQKDKITKEAVAAAQRTAVKMTMEDLFASAEMGEFRGAKTARIKMKNGRTLTTLVQTDGKWLADTIWFR
jgi:hypothetical protein